MKHQSINVSNLKKNERAKTRVNQCSNLKKKERDKTRVNKCLKLMKKDTDKTPGTSQSMFKFEEERKR